MEYVPLLVDKMQAAINAAAGAVTAKRAVRDGSKSLSWGRS